MAEMLNKLHSSVDSAEFEDLLSPEARVILRSVTGSPPYFASLFLPFFYEKSLLFKLTDSKDSIDELYSNFCAYVSDKADYSSLNKARKDLAAEKISFNNITRSIGNKLESKQVIVHRVSSPTAISQLQHNKCIVISLWVPELFPFDEYVYLSLQTSHVIEPTSPHIEYHILVWDNCPFEDDESVILSKVGINNDTPWYVGMVIFNLYKITPIFGDFVRSSHFKLFLNASAQRSVKRSKV